MNPLQIVHLESNDAEADLVHSELQHDMDSSVTWQPLGEVLGEDERLKLGGS